MPGATESMRAGTVSLQAWCEHSEHPKEKVSRYTGRLGSLGLTLYRNYPYPHHSTHTLQPLGVVVFEPLSTASSKKLETRFHKRRDLDMI